MTFNKTECATMTPTDTLTQHRDELLAAINRDKGVMRGHNTVLRTEHGLFLRQGGGFFAPRGVLSASMYSPEDAATLAKELESPTGTAPTPVLYHHALQEELAGVQKSLEYFTS
jgi:hypothetical protein